MNPDVVKANDNDDAAFMKRFCSGEKHAFYTEALTTRGTFTSITF